MAALASGNAPQHVAEIKTLRRDFGEDFELIGPKVSAATEADPTRVRIKRNVPAALAVVVTLPAAYPSDASPLFAVEAAKLGDAHREALADLLAEQASYMRGISAVSTALMALDDVDLATLDVGTEGRCRSVFAVDVVNNSPHFKKSLEGAANGNPCRYFYRNIECQNNAKFSFAKDPWRSVFVVCDCPTAATAKAFMKTIRTDGAMDCDMLGKPGKIQMSVVEEFELRPKAPGLPDGFSGDEYRTDAARGELMDPLLAAAAGL